MTPLLNSTPMPGENIEKSSGEKRENGAETKAENPEYNRGFDTLGEVPYSGDDPYTGESLTETVASSSVPAEKIYEEQKAGKAADLNAVKDSVRADYNSNAIDAPLTDGRAIAAATEAVTGTGDGITEGSLNDKQNAITLGAAAEAVALNAAAEKTAKSFTTDGDISDLEEKIQEAEKMVALSEGMSDQITNNEQKKTNDGLNDQTEKMLDDAKAKLDEAKTTSEQFKTEFGDVKDEVKDSIEEEAKKNDTTVYDAVNNLQAADKLEIVSTKNADDKLEIVSSKNDDNQLEIVNTKNADDKLEIVSNKNTDDKLEIVDDNFDIAKILANGKYS